MGKQVKKHGYSCKLVRVVDGDTADAMVDLGFNVWHKVRIRFYGVDTWESRTRDLEEKKKGLEAKEFTKHLLQDSDDGKFSLSNSFTDFSCPLTNNSPNTLPYLPTPCDMIENLPSSESSNKCLVKAFASKPFFFSSKSRVLLSQVSTP